MKTLKIILLAIGLVVLFLLFRSTFFPALDKFIFEKFYLKNLSGDPKVDNKEDCLSRGGDWLKAGLAPKETCRIPAKDAGKKCFAGFQCQYGDCFMQLNLRNPAKLGTGFCPKYRPSYGCKQKVHFGLTDKGICAD